MGGAEVQVCGQVRLGELHVPQTTGEGRPDGQTVLFDSTCRNQKDLRSAQVCVFACPPFAHAILTWIPANIDRVVGLSRGGLWVGVGGGVLPAVDS